MVDLSKACRPGLPVLGLFLAFLLILAPLKTASAQGASAFNARVLDAHEGEQLAGVNVRVEGSNIGGATGANGRITISNVPDGRQSIIFSFVGFETIRLELVFPLADPETVREVRMEEAHEEMEEVSVSALRTSRTIADQASRVETIAGEEIDEKISMEPSNISMLLNESPGITVQQTSAVSGGASIRIQGLDGRYTQLLKDGFPLYGGFSGGLSLLQVPPLDLQQVEIIKGPASTLYGGDAIAGLVNLVTKGPGHDPELATLVNATSAGGVDLGGFYRARGDRFGITMLASANAQQAYDADADAFSNLPETRRLTLNPKLFFYPSPQTTLSLGVLATGERREGGDMSGIGQEPAVGSPFIELSESTRLTSQARMDHRTNSLSLLTVKNSVSFFDRTIAVPDYRFDGQQVATYSEVSGLRNGDAHDTVVGVDLRTDDFRERAANGIAVRDYSYASIGAFVQDTWDVTDRTVIEGGLRLESHNRFGLFVLPKASARVRLTDRLTARAGGGLGYKAPTVFLEPSEERVFRDVAPLSDNLEAETSRGGSVDINYRALVLDRLAVTLNQAYYFTNLDSPLVPVVVGSRLTYRNANGAMETRAWETNARIAWGDLKLFLGYVYLRARVDLKEGETPLPLTPEHKTYSVLVFEKHGTGRVGLEAYYTGPQDLSNGARTEGYWIVGLMAERRLGPVRAFLNFENFLDTKQRNYGPVVLGSRAQPRFAEIWAPMDGFIVNGGIKIVR